MHSMYMYKYICRNMICPSQAWQMQVILEKVLRQGGRTCSRKSCRQHASHALKKHMVFVSTLDRILLIGTWRGTCQVCRYVRTGLTLIQLSRLDLCARAYMGSRIEISAVGHNSRHHEASGNVIFTGPLFFPGRAGLPGGFDTDSGVMLPGTTYGGLRCPSKLAQPYHYPHRRHCNHAAPIPKHILASFLAASVSSSRVEWSSATRGKPARRRSTVLCLPEGSAELPRKLVVISGSAFWTEQIGREALQVIEIEAARSGHKLRALITHDFRADKPPPVSEWMGQELDAALLSVQRLNFLDTFGAVCGALRGGGVLLLCTPRFEEWKADSSAGLRWCREIETLAAEQHATWSHFMDEETWQTSELVRRLTDIMPIWPQRIPRKMDATADQQSIIQAVMQTSSASPLLISGRRGRGKSAALGLAATVLLRRGCERILVTSPSRESTQQLFDSAERAAKDVPTDLHVSRTDPGCLEIGQVGCLKYVPVSELLGSRGQELLRSCQYLFVDEAAGIPAAEAKRLLTRTKRVVMATTLDGYEGSGQGFLLRALPALRETKRDLRHLQLVAPLRWRDGLGPGGRLSHGQSSL